MKDDFVCVGYVCDEAGEFYIFRNVDCPTEHKTKKEFTGIDIEVPEKIKIFGSFIINKNDYYYAKKKG